MVAKKEAPEPKTAAGKITVLVTEVEAGPGLNSAGSPYAMYQWGAGENMFQAVDMGHWAEPMLCTSYEMAEDYSKVILHIREGVQFHYGWGEMTAEDVAWSLNDHNAYTNPESIGYQAGDYAALFYEWKAIDKYTVEAPFQEYDPKWNTFLLSQHGQSSPTFSKKAYDEKGADWMRANVVATGPLQVVSWARDEKAVLEKVPYTHWRISVKYNEITFIEVPEETAMLAMIRAGEADAAGFRLAHVTSLLEEGFKAVTWNGNHIGIFWSGNLWETTHALTGEPLDTSAVYARKVPWVANPNNPTEMEESRQVRWAVAEAIDREAINEVILGGLGWPVYREYCDPSVPYHKDEWVINYDLESAKARLAKTRWPNGFEIPFYPQGGDTTKAAIADALVVQTLKLGPAMVPTSPKMAYPVFRPGVVTRTTVLPWVTECDEGLINWPFDWPKAKVMTSMTRGGFGCGFESPEIAQWFLQAVAEKDTEKRIQINIQVIDYLSYWQLDTGIVANPAMTVINPKSIKEWPHPPSLMGGADSYENIVPAR